MKILNIIMPAIESESGLLKKNLPDLLERLGRAGIRDYRVFVIFQTRGMAPVELGGPYPPEVKIHEVPFFSTSRARNLGLSMVQLGPDNFVYFLDCDAMPSDDFLGMAKEVLEGDIPFAMGSVYWGLEDSRYPSRNSPATSRRKRIKPVWSVRRHYLWITIIRGDMIHGIRFNERIGPGESTALKAGEDVLYFYDVVKQNRLSEFVAYPQCFVYHPERPADLSKELLYASGQGAMYRYLLRDLGLPAGAWLGVMHMIVLFLGNGLYRALMFRHNGFRILMERLRGMLSGDLQVYFKTSAQ